MSAQTIYIKLRQAGMSAVGACAMMGNMQDESGLKANNVQNGMGYSDDDYTAATDGGLIDFVSDQRGYGLCQWTYPGRKLNLLNFARSRGVSVGDEDMQVDFCIHELRTEYSNLWQYLCTATGVAEAASKVCREYERPAETVVNVQERAAFANQFYMTLSKLDISDNAPTGSSSDSVFHTPAVEVFWPPRMLEYGMTGADVVALQGLLTAHGFNVSCDGVFGNKTKAALAGFQAESFGYGNGVADEATWATLTRR